MSEAPGQHGPGKIKPGLDTDNFMPTDTMEQRMKKRALEEASDRLREAMAPPDSLGLHPLLEKRRWEHGIPNGAFKHQAAYDRVLVQQIIGEQEAKGTYGGGLIHMTDRAKAREKDSYPRGVIVSAGLQALDVLRSNGMDIGHVVTFVRLAPWRMRVETVAGIEYHLMVLRAGDIIASEDLAHQLSTGERAVLQLKDKARVEHVYTVSGAAGEYVLAELAEIDEAY